MKKILIVSIIIILALFIVGYILQRNNFFSKLFESIILDSKSHYLTCDKLPDIQTVEKIFSENKKIVEKIQKMADITIHRYDSEECENKADINIEYCCHDIRVKIEKLIGNTFFGIPYNMKNT